MKYPHKRIFPRYKMDHDLVLELDGRKVNARLIDLSVDGVGVVVDGPAPPASYVGIRVDAIDMQARGEIVWARDHIYGTRLGIRRTGPLKGDMRNYRPADLLLGIHKMGKTGVLRTVARLSSKYVYFSNGTVVFATSDNEDREVCESLLYNGKISAEQFDQSVGLARETGKNQVAALLEAGHTRPEDIALAVHRQAEKVLMSLLNLDEGGFIFREGPLPPEKMLSGFFNITDLIFQWTKQFGDPQKISELCRERESILFLNSAAGEDLNKLRLDERETGLMRFLNRERTVREVLSMSPLGEAETLGMLYALYNVQALEIIESGASENAASGERDPALGERELEAVHRIEKLFNEYRSLGYDGVLNVSRHAPMEEIKRAYYRMAREFHPDRHLYISSNAIKEKLNIIFSYINEAYEALTSTQERQQEPLSEKTGGGDLSYGQMARQKYEAGMGFMRNGDHKQALTLFGQATNLDNTIPKYHHYFGLELFRLGKVREAEASLRRASQLAPDNAVYIAELGHIYLALGFVTRAKNSFEKALKFDPSNKRASEGLERCGP